MDLFTPDISLSLPQQYRLAASMIPLARLADTCRIPPDWWMAPLIHGAGSACKAPHNRFHQSGVTIEPLSRKTTTSASSWAIRRLKQVAAPNGFALSRCTRSGVSRVVPGAHHRARPVCMARLCAVGHSAGCAAFRLDRHSTRYRWSPSVDRPHPVNKRRALSMMMLARLAEIRKISAKRAASREATSAGCVMPLSIKRSLNVGPIPFTSSRVLPGNATDRRSEG